MVLFARISEVFAANPNFGYLLGLGGLLGLLIGFAIAKLTRKPQIIDKTDTDANLSREVFKNSGQVCLIWPDDDDATDSSIAPQIVGDDKIRAKIQSVLKCESQEIFKTLCDGDAVLCEKVNQLRTRGIAFETMSRAIEIEGFVFGSRACLMLKIAPTNYGARGTSNFETPIWKNDNSGNLVWGNRAFLHAVEYNNLDEAIDANARFDMKAQLEVQSALKGQTTIDTRAISINGDRRMMRVFCAPAFDGTMGIAFDINDEFQAQEFLKREAKAHLEVLNGLNDAVVVFDNRRNLQTYNNAFLKLWGLEETWVLEKPSHEEWLDRLRSKSWLSIPKDYLQWRNDEIAYYLANTPIPDEVWSLRDGRVLRIMRQRQPNGGLLILFEDISDKTILQAKYKTQIEVSNATLDRLLEGVGVFTSSGHLALANSAFCQIWDIDNGSELSGLSFQEFNKSAEKLYNSEEFWNELNARICDPTPTGRRETNGQIKLKNEIVLDWLTRPLPDGATLVVFRDVSAQIQMESVLNDKAFALQEADKLKSAFLEKVSYHLRTPLNTISGYADALLSGIAEELMPLQRNYIESMHEASGHLKSMIDDLLNLAVIDAGQVPLELAEVNIPDVLEKIREMAATKPADTRINVEVRNEGAGIIRADSFKLRQAMFNLVENAIRNASPGDTIIVGARQFEGSLRLYVSSPNHNFDHLGAPMEFEAFTDVAKRGGLSLVLVKKLIDMHGGWIGMGSKEPGIFTITCHLPVEAKSSANVPELELQS